MKYRLRWTGHIVQMGRQMHTEFWQGTFLENNHMEDQGDARNEDVRVEGGWKCQTSVLAVLNLQTP
jgi:hypothetical protein